MNTPMNIRLLNKSDVLVENMQIHEYLTEVSQIGRREFRVYPPYYVLPPPGNCRSNIGMGRGRGNLMGEDIEDVHAMRRCYITPLVQMEEAERQFNRGQIAENRERQMVRDNEREYEVIILENELETTDKPVEVNVAPPRSPIPELTPESRSRTSESSSHHPNEERPEISTPHSRPSLNITSEREKSQHMKPELYHPALLYQVAQLQMYPPLHGHLYQTMKEY